jgi:hypothetical protein
MKRKQNVMPLALLSWMTGAIGFTATIDVSAGPVQPPPRPAVITVIEPGEVDREKDLATHGHHHKGHIKKDKTKEVDADVKDKVKQEGAGS